MQKIKAEIRKMRQNLAYGIIVYVSIHLYYASKPYGNATVPENRVVTSNEMVVIYQAENFKEDQVVSMRFNI